MSFPILSSLIALPIIGAVLLLFVRVRPGDDGAQAALAYENSASDPTNRRPSVAVRVACCR